MEEAVATIRGIALGIGILLFACSPAICAWLICSALGNRILLCVGRALCVEPCRRCQCCDGGDCDDDECDRHHAARGEKKYK